MFDDFRFSLKSAYHSALAETKVFINQSIVPYQMTKKVSRTERLGFSCSF
jgi:hypothetical protein